MFGGFLKINLLKLILLFFIFNFKALALDTKIPVTNEEWDKAYASLNWKKGPSLVNFNLLKEYFIHKKLKVKKIVSQKFFLERLGILERANIISKNMNFREKADLFFRIKRLIDPKIMGKLFKVIFAYKSKKENFVGFN